MFHGNFESAKILTSPETKAMADWAALGHNNPSLAHKELDMSSVGHMLLLVGWDYLPSLINISSLTPTYA